MSAGAGVGEASPERAFAAERRVRLGDVGPDRCVRLDAVARYLQDVAADDVRDAGLRDVAVWVVRSTELVLHRRPRYDDTVCLVTWCAGTGAAWAQRRTTVSDAEGPAIEASSVWAALDPVRMRPAPLPEDFFAVYGESARARRVKARLALDPTPPPGAVRRPWPLRSTDFDMLGHVNNAVAWAVVDESGPAVVRGTVEYRSAIGWRDPLGPRGALELATATDPGGTTLWLVDGEAGTAVVARASAG